METKILYFICEGLTEVTLIKKLLEKNGYHSLKNDKDEKKDLILFDLSSQKNTKIYLANCEGKDKCKKYVNSLLKSINDENFEIVFFLDADDSSEDSSITGVKRTKDLVENILKKEDCSYSSYILPNNIEDGMTETLLNKCFLCNKTVKYIEETTFKEIEELKEIIINNKHKSLFMIMAALLAKKGVAHHFIENNFKSFDGNNEDLKKLENWILDKIS
ncbi:hypothetical protein LDK30_01640 [Fusobacterium polymorphum]|uniref:Uncharacterized protein n=1 Tax=Fusobacterium nucleatum subsp. polymorphum TaxID=76857 RepID=A0A2C6C9L5_FUSNP|nr:DUF3226 domain-containing protein [Fusobacterium polymorphum]PHI13081.1 hypothetical protein CBG59_04755 [Fusobacterium polymorphum]